MKYIKLNRSFYQILYIAQVWNYYCVFYRTQKFNRISLNITKFFSIKIFVEAKLLQHML